MSEQESKAEKYLLDMLADIDRKHLEARQPIIDELSRLHVIRLRPYMMTVLSTDYLIDSLDVKIPDRTVIKD